jgi:hypothetical protein
MQWSPFASFGTNFSFITQGKQRSQNAKVPECKGPPLHNAVIVFHLLKVLLTRYNCLHLILCPRKPLRGLCRWGHLHIIRVCKGPPLHNAVIVFHLLKVLLTRYNCLHLILCPRKPLRGLCRWGHLHTLSSAHSYNCTPFHLHIHPSTPPTSTYRDNE